MTGPAKSSRALARRLNMLYVTAFAIAAAAVTAVAYAVSRLLPEQTRLPVAAAGALLLFLAACDARLGPLRTPSLRRQTCPAWRLRFGLAPATALWGLDIGTTLTTIKMTSLYWAAFVLLFTGARPQLHAVVAIFAAGYLVTHLVVVWRVSRTGGVDAAVAQVNGHTAQARLASAGVLSILGVLMIVQGIAG